jgi:hypothetical protein
MGLSIVDPKMSMEMSSRGYGGLLAFLMLLVITIYGLNIWSLTYMFKLEKNKCQCSLGWKHRFIQVMLFVILLQPILFTVADKFNMGNIVRGIISIASIAYVVIAFMYIKELEDTKCYCSDSPARTTLKVLNYINIALIVILIVAFIFAIKMLAKVMKDSNKAPALSIERAPLLAPARATNDIIQSIPSNSSKKIKRKSNSKSK